MLHILLATHTSAPPPVAHMSNKESSGKFSRAVWCFMSCQWRRSWTAAWGVGELSEASSLGRIGARRHFGPRRIMRRRLGWWWGVCWWGRCQAPGVAVAGDGSGQRWSSKDGRGGGGAGAVAPRTNLPREGQGGPCEKDRTRGRRPPMTCCARGRSSSPEQHHLPRASIRWIRGLQMSSTQ